MLKDTELWATVTSLPLILQLYLFHVI